MANGEYKMSIAKNNLINLSSEYNDSVDVNFAGTNIAETWANWAGFRAGTPSYNFGNYDVNVRDTGKFGEDLTYPSYWFRKQQNFTYQTTQWNKTWVAARTEMYYARSYFASNNVYKNGTYLTGFSQTWNQQIGMQLTKGDVITSDRPMAIRGTYYDLGMVYMGWAGYTFAHRHDRYAPKELHIVACEAGTNYKVLYTTSDGHVTALSQATAGTINSDLGIATFSMSTITRNYVIIADRPIACLVEDVSSTGTRDTMPLFPMNADPKYGWISNSGHSISVPNLAQWRSGNNNTNAGLLQYTTANNTYIEWTATTSPQSVYTDSALTATGTLFSGAGGKFVCNGSEMFMVEQQGDSNGGEMTQLVSAAAFGTVGMIMDTAGWVALISNQPCDIEWYDQQDNLLSAFTLSGNATQGVYKYYINSGVSAGHHFVSVGPGARPPGFFIYYDAQSPGGDERCVIMSDAYGPMV